MKYLIDNSDYNLRNVGDDCMLLVTITEIQKLDADAEIYVFTDNPEGLSELCSTVRPLSIRGRLQWISKWNLFGGIHKLIPRQFKEKLYLWEILFKVKFHRFASRYIISKLDQGDKNSHEIREFLDVISKVDFVIASGGGYINDSFYEHGQRTLSTLLLAQSFGKKTALFGQGVGPIQNKELEGLAKKVFPKIEAIGLREGLFSPELVAKLGCPASKIFVTGDDAIRLARNSSSETIGNFIGVNIRVASYSAMSGQQLKIYKEILDKVSASFGASYKAIPISAHTGEEDYDSIAKLIDIDQTKDELNSFMKVISNTSSCRVVVTGSYHAGVFALSQGIPVVALCKSVYYKQKFDGLKNQFKVGCVLIDMNDSAVADLIEKSITELWELSAEFKPTLLVEADKQISNSENLYKTVFSPHKQKCS